MGLSLRDVHAVTGIPLNCLAALEEGDLSQFPSPVYARGYIRSYAEAVRLDGDGLALELWRRMEEAQVAASSGTATASARLRTRSSAAAPPQPPAPPPARQRTRPTNGRRPSSLAPLRQPASPWVPKPGRIRRMAPGLERVAIGMLLVVLAVGIWDLQRSRPVNKPKPPTQAAAIAQTHDTEPPTTPPRPPTSPTASTTPVSDNGSLAVYASGRDQFAVLLQATDAACWVQVRASEGGPVLYEGTLQPGQSQPFDATHTLWVRVGNLGHANLLVDGAPLVLPNKPSFPYNVLLQT
jgi:cytoskeletal protein RodZ